MEYFDIVDEQGNPTGQTVERKQAHRNNILHRTAHVWIVRRRGNSIQILLQKRCMEKDSFPGCYDISSAGHIPAGVDYIPSALRELREELGLTIDSAQLIDCGLHRHHADEVFHGEKISGQPDQARCFFCGSMWTKRTSPCRRRKSTL